MHLLNYLHFKMARRAIGAGFSGFNVLIRLPDAHHVIASKRHHIYVIAFFKKNSHFGSLSITVFPFYRLVAFLWALKMCGFISAFQSAGGGIK